jgi:ABC-2 type transport system permease protein
LQNGSDWMHIAALWSTAAAAVVAVSWAFERWHFAGFSKAQEARKARFTQWRALDRVVALLPMSPVRRHLLIKDLKVFLRDVSQWSQLLLLLALMLVYLYNFRVLDLDRIPYMSSTLKNVYAFLNLAMAGFVMSTVAVRFVFPAVSAEGAAFWIIRTAPISLKDFLWSKFWTGLVPVLILTEILIVVGNELLGVDPFLRRMSAVAIVFMAFALVGLACGLGARYPRFAADNPSQVAGSYGGIAFMILAVLFILAMIVLLGWPSSIYLFAQFRGRPLTSGQEIFIIASFAAAAVLSIATWWLGMRTGVRALQEMDRTPS